MHVLRRVAVLALLALGANGARAAVLAEDRADLMYHRYQGGGITVDGPSVLVRKKFGESLAATANYYIDNITSASIDVVVSGASRYAERREQKSLALEYLRGKTTYSASYTNSKENDYRADTYSLSVSQDMFGDLTTVSFGYAQGLDKIGSSVDPTFADEIERRNYRPARLVQLRDRDRAGLPAEPVPLHAFPQRGRHVFARTGSFPPHAHQQRRLADAQVLPALAGGGAGAVPLLHRHLGHQCPHGQPRVHPSAVEPLGVFRLVPLLHADGRHVLERSVPARRLPELHGTHTIGIGASYEFPVEWAGSWLQKGSANLRVNHMMVDYSRFRDLRDFPPGTATPGTEPLYALDANFLTFYVSFFF